MNRIMMRAALSGLAFGLAGACQSLAQTGLPPADATRIEARILALSAFGANEDGGVDRVAYSKADLAARDWLIGQLTAQGMADIRVDAGGNIRATRPGTDPNAKPIMFGSHIDSVLGGGNYDGQAGVVASLEAIDLLNAGAMETASPFEFIVFSNEEGGLVGSLALTGALKAETLALPSDAGVTIGEGIGIIGGDVSRLAEDVVPPGALKAFVEPHIEQGAFLDRGGVDIGVVEGIVGIEWWDITVTGVANHAGTTPMGERTDALLAASEMVLAVNEAALAMEGRHVATVGRIRALPGAPNVIPGEAVFSLEIRDLEQDKMFAVFEAIEARLREIAERRGTGLGIRRLEVASEPALTDPSVQAHIAAAAEALGLSYRFMPSGAGHDAQDMARIAPTGMIFMPSVGGVSHSPKEFTRAQDIANGADVLVRTLLAIDAEEVPE